MQNVKDLHFQKAKVKVFENVTIVSQCPIDRTGRDQDISYIAARIEC